MNQIKSDGVDVSLQTQIKRIVGAVEKYIIRFMSKNGMSTIKESDLALVLYSFLHERDDFRAKNLKGQLEVFFPVYINVYSYLSDKDMLEKDILQKATQKKSITADSIFFSKRLKIRKGLFPKDLLKRKKAKMFFDERKKEEGDFYVLEYIDYYTLKLLSKYRGKINPVEKKDRTREFFSQFLPFYLSKIANIKFAIDLDLKKGQTAFIIDKETHSYVKEVEKDLRSIQQILEAGQRNRQEDIKRTLKNTIESTIENTVENILKKEIERRKREENIRKTFKNIVENTIESTIENTLKKAIERRRREENIKRAFKNIIESTIESTIENTLKKAIEIRTIEETEPLKTKRRKGPSL